jgi:hypothetical protein
MHPPSFGYARFIPHSALRNTIRPHGTPMSLNTSSFSLKADCDHTVFHDYRDFALSGRMPKHDFQLVWITHYIQVLHGLASFGKCLTGSYSERSSVFSKDKKLIRHSVLGTSS